jgi:transcriptional regulator with XRE-family HTH domain
MNQNLYLEMIQMPSFQITIIPSKRAAGRFISKVRRSIQKALAEEERETGISQSDIARAIGVNRSVVSREIRGHKDLTLSRVAEIAWALGRKPVFDLPKETRPKRSNLPPPTMQTVPMQPTTATTSWPLPSDPMDTIKAYDSLNVPVL